MKETSRTPGQKSNIRRWALILTLLIAAGAAVAYVWRDLLGGDTSLESGFAVANGRIEVERVDISTKYAGRVSDILVQEGDTVAAGDIISTLDTTELNAELAAIQAAVRSARQGIARAEAEVSLREAEHHLSELELARVADLASKGIASSADLERRSAQHAIAEANLLGAHAAVGTAKAATDQAEAQVAQLNAMIAEMTLRAPVAGRVEYRLVQPGAVIGSGARVATILDLSRVYMSVFLPTSQAGTQALGAEVRIALDAAPGFVIPAHVSFVAAEAQFTPKAVETANEREKLMYRVKLRIPAALLEQYQNYVKAGYTGNAYLRLDSASEWPPDLEVRLPDVQ